MTIIARRFNRFLRWFFNASPHLQRIEPRSRDRRIALPLRERSGAEMPLSGTDGRGNQPRSHLPR